MAESEEDKFWTPERTLLLLRVRLEKDNEFEGKNRKRADIWEKILSEMKEEDENFPFNKDEIIRKFLNIMMSYKRIKRRHATSMEVSTTWEYFDIIDKVYGTRSDASVPEYTLDCSLIEIEHMPSDSHDSIPSPIIEHSITPKEPPRKRARSEMLDYLRREATADRELMREFLELEKEKRKVELQKIEEMRKIRDMLSNFTNLDQTS